MSLLPSVAVVACGAFLAFSAATFAGAVLLVRRARRAEASARSVLEASTRYREEGTRALAEARRIHATCRPSPFDVRTNIMGPLGVVRRGVS